MKQGFLKTLCGLTAVSLLLSNLSPTIAVAADETAPAFSADVNGDGSIDEKDRDAILDVIASSIETISSIDGFEQYDANNNGIVDAADALAVDQYVKKTRKALPAPYGDYLDDSLTFALTDSACFVGEDATLDFSIVDWSKDIAAYDFVFHVPNGLTPKSAACTGSARTIVKGNAIRVFGLASDLELNRGKIASLTFHSDLSGDIPVSLDVSNVYDSELNYYHSEDPTANVTVYDTFSPVALVADGISSKSVMLSWEMPYSEAPVSGFGIFRNGEQIADSVETSYLDTDLAPDTEYTYTVCAYNVNGDQTDPSLPLTVTTAAPKIESAAFPADSVAFTNCDLTVKLAQKTVLSEMTILVGTGKTAVKDTVKFDPEGITEWTHHLDVSALASEEYPVKVTVTDLDGATDSAEISVFIQNSQPAPLTIQGYAGGETATLTWEIAPEADVTGYRVYRQTPDDKELQLIGTIDSRSKLDYTDTKLDATLEYTYGVTAVNGYGIESEMSNLVTVKPEADTVQPEITYFYPTKNARLSGENTVIVRASDNSRMDHVACLISEDEGKTWNDLFTADGTEGRWTLDTADYKDGIYQLKAMAYDAAGNQSLETSIVTLDFDNTAPEAVTGVSLKEPAQPTSAVIQWNDVADEDFSAFLVYLSTGSTVKTYTVNTQLGISLTGLSAGVEYSITVAAVDQTGNVGAVSEPFVFETPYDIAPPVITDVSCPQVISSRAAAYFTIKAVDNSAITTYYIQLSQDKENWTTHSSSNYYFTLYESNLVDGPVYVRVYARDAYGNVGNPDEAEIITITADVTPPAAIEDVTAEQLTNGIKLTWTAPETAASYQLERSTSESFSSIEYISNRFYSTQYTDTTVRPDTTYYYRIASFDSLENMSQYSEPVSIHYAKDETAPVINSVYLSYNDIICESARTFQVIAKDEVAMASIDLSYAADDSDSWTAFSGTTEFSADKKQLHIIGELPDAVLDAKTVKIRVVATDAAGNSSEPKDYSYIVNNGKTEITNLTITKGDSQVLISWDSPDVSQTALFEVFRTVNGGKEYCLGSIRPTPDTTHYTFSDTRLEESGTYVYRVLATQTTGNKNSVTEEPIQVQSIPRPVLNVDSPQQLGASYFFDATASQNADEITSVVLDYGDGSTDTASKVSAAKFQHTYAETGTYTATLTCSNSDGISKSCTKTIVVEDASHIAKVLVNVKTTAGTAAKNATVYVDVGTDEQVTYVTDENGFVSFTATDGDHEIGVFGSNYLPVTKTVTLIAGAENKVDFSVVCDEIVDATFKISRMSLSEIKAAGIDVTSRQNLNIVRIDVQICYSDVIHSKEELKMFYDYDEHRFYLPDELREKGYEVHSVQFDKNEEISAIVLMNIPTEVQSLKEFFKVSLIVTNNADTEYTLQNTAVTLNVPAGLTIMEENSSPRTVTLGDIAGQSSAEASWIVRGDAKGSYNVSADFSAVLSKFNESVSRNFVSEQKINVIGSSALDIHVNLNPYIAGNRLLAEVAIKNVSSIPVYEVGADIKDQLYEINYSELALGTATLIQSRFTGKDKILKVLDEMPNVVETLNPGETFSLLYSITGFNGEYNFKTLSAIGDTLEAKVQGDAKVTVSITPVSRVDTNSLFYGIAFDREKDFLFAVRNNARRELSDAHVCVYSYENNKKVILGEGDTDERGRIIIPRGDPTKKYYVTAQKDGYDRYYDPNFHFTSTGISDTIILHGDYDEADYQLVSAYLVENSRYHNLLRSSYSLMVGDGKQFEIHATGVDGITKYQLMQDQRTLDTCTPEGNTAVFDNLETSDFRTQKNVFVRCFIETGEYIDTPLNLVINEDPSRYEETVAQAVANATAPESSVSVRIPDAIEFCAGMEINLKISAFSRGDVSVSMSVSNEGVVKFSATFNTKKKPEKTLAEGISDLDNILSDPKSHKEFKIGKGKGSFSISGYFEGTYDAKTGDHTFTGKVMANFSFNDTIFSGRTVIWVIPVYYGLDFGFTLSGGFMLSYSTKETEGWKFRVLLEASATLSAYGCAGAKVPGTSIGVGIGPKVSASSTFKFEFLPAKITLWNISGKVYLHVDYVIGSADIKLFDLFNVNIIPNDKVLSRDMIKSLGLSDIQAEEINAAIQEAAQQPSPETPKAIWNGTISASNALDILETNCAGTSNVQLIPYGDTAMMLWNSQNTERGKYNANYLAYSIYNTETGTWSEPKAVDDNKNIDVLSAAVATENGIYVAYQEIDTEYADDDTIDFAEFSKHYTITTCRFDAETGTFTDFNTMPAAAEGTHANIPSFIEATDGTLYLIWSENTNGSFTSADTDNVLRYATLGEDGWSEPQTFVQNITSPDSFVCLCNELGAPVIAYFSDKDCDPATTDDIQLIVADMEGTTHVLAEGALSHLYSGELPQGGNGLLWMNQSQFNYSVNLSDAAEMDTPAGYLMNGFTVCGNRMLFTAPSDNGSVLCSVEYDAESQSFSKPVVLSQSADISLTAPQTIAVGDTMLYALHGLQFVSTEDSFSSANLLLGGKIAETTNVKLDKVSFSASDAKANEAFPITLSITNDGTKAVSKVTASLIGHDEAVIDSAEIATDLGSGQSGQFTFSPKLPADFLTEYYEIRIAADGEETNSEDNSAQLNLALTDLTLTSYIEYVGDDEDVTIIVENKGNLPTTAYIKAENSNEETMRLIPDEIAPHSSVIFTVDGKELLGTAYRDFVTLTVVSDAVEDFNEGNNMQTLILSQGGFHDEILGDVDYNGVIDSDDADLALKYFLDTMIGSEPCITEAQANMTDVNQDGVSNADDANMILLYYLNTMMGLTTDPLPVFIDSYFTGGTAE